MRICMTATAEVNGARLTYSDIGDGVPLLCLQGGMGVDARTFHVPGILNLDDTSVTAREEDR
jgi:hypothetical protein